MNLIDIVAILPYFITLATREDEKTLVQADLSEDKDTNKETIQTFILSLRPRKSEKKIRCLVHKNEFEYGMIFDDFLNPTIWGPDSGLLTFKFNLRPASLQIVGK